MTGESHRKKGNIMETERLILRRWGESDAEDLYKNASDPAVGPIAGWPVHQNIEESRKIIRTVFCGEEAYAICLKQDNRAVGAIELKLRGRSDLIENDDECEAGVLAWQIVLGSGINAGSCA
jgi:RimJ/RimL family protein N-acetyltransferase